MCFSFLTSLQSLTSTPNLLVIGGTGFVGRKFVEEFSLIYPKCKITSISRRGKRQDEAMTNINWVAGDANVILDDTVSQYGPFDVCVHAVGLLLDNESGFASWNRLASGSGSVPDEKSSYDYVTRLTAFNAIRAMENSITQTNTSIENRPVFVFISAAEAGWTLKPPVVWLARYLDAKRDVERRLQSSDKVRSVIFRPSLIWTTERPLALFSVLPFYIGSAIGLPFVDRPVLLESLVRAMITAIGDKNVQGVQRFKQIDNLSESCVSHIN